MVTLDSRKEGETLVVSFQDVRIIDETRINSLGQELNDFLSSGNEKIIVNFENVNFMSSAMIGKLVQFGKKCEASKVKLRFCNINSNVLEVFNLMKLNKVFEIDAEESTSLESIGKKSWFGR